MPLSAGDRLGPYEILAPIGAGGMGEVYRAKDTKLGREVALKVLPESFAQDPDRLARFEREAKVLASLNHPNIAQIYGIEERALVMELVPGETLIGPLPLATALNYAKQIADALEAAHDKGIIHRDLKPANIIVTPDDVVKVLDFGLAAAPQPSSAGTSDRNNSPTLTMSATAVGMIMGTAAYMSPEQAAGKPVDKRTDVWSYGVVLWEMLSGRPLFQGETISHTLADVLRMSIDFDQLPKETPRAVRDLLARCLERDAKARLRDIGEARVVIQRYLSNPGTETKTPQRAQTAPPRTRLGRAWPGVAAALAVGLAIAVWAPWRAERPLNRPLVRLDVDLGAGISLPAPNGAGSSVAISPDGTRLAYSSGTPGRLFTRRLDQPKATELQGTEGATVPFFSPDGRWVGFDARGRLNKVSVEGGAVIPLGDIGLLHGASWSEDGSIFVGASQNCLRIPAGGGRPEPIVEMRSGELGLAPEVLPGGKAILLAVDHAGPVDETTIEVLTLADRHRKILVRGGASPKYLATSNGGGYLVYLNQATLFAIPFDLASLETNGTAVPVVDDVAHESLVGTGQFDVSRSGTLVYRRTNGGASAMMTLQWADPAGNKQSLRIKPGAYSYPRLSPDGTKVALAIFAGGSQDVWVYDLRRDALMRLTFGGVNNFATWSPDGRFIAFSNVGHGLFWAGADGARPPQALTESKVLQYPWSFSPDGKLLAYTEFDANRQIWTVPIEEQGGQIKAGTPDQFLKSGFADLSPNFSPDGRWLAYCSDESGTSEVYVRSFPARALGQGGKWQVSNGGGTTPRWSRGGHQLMYQSGDRVMTASYTVEGDTFMVENSQVWIARLGGTQWDVAPDGKRVILLAPIESADAPEHEVVFLENFFDELRRRLPLDK